MLYKRIKCAICKTNGSKIYINSTLLGYNKGSSNYLPTNSRKKKNNKIFCYSLAVIVLNTKCFN